MFMSYHTTNLRFNLVDSVSKTKQNSRAFSVGLYTISNLYILIYTYFKTLNVHTHTHARRTSFAPLRRV